MDYDVIVEESLSQLENKVKKMLKEGWKPTGGIAVESNLSEITGETSSFTWTRMKAVSKCRYYQAMVRE
jgi:hypothetical protein